MPPKRSPPSTRAVTTSAPKASKGIEGVYQALTAKENQTVVRSIAIFGVSHISIFLCSFFFSSCGCRWERRGCELDGKYFVAGKRKPMEEYGGRTIRRFVKWRAKTERARSCLFLRRASPIVDSPASVVAHDFHLSWTTVSQRRSHLRTEITNVLLSPHLACCCLHLKFLERISPTAVSFLRLSTLSIFPFSNLVELRCLILSAFCYFVMSAGPYSKILIYKRSGSQVTRG